MPAESTATAALWQQEQRRRVLLQRLGIMPLISRPHITGAATKRLSAPVVASVVTPVTEGRPPKSQSPSPSNAQSTLAALKSAVAKSDNPVSAAGATHDDNMGSAPTTEVPDAVSFSLLIASAGPFLWVEHLPDALITREQLQLLQSIAFTVAGADAQLGHRQFDWPLVDAPQLPKDLVTARQSVAGHLTRWAKEQSAQTLVVCGESTSRFLLEVPSLSQLHIPSLRDMLATPAMKRRAWHSLQPLTKQ